jgi:hypothetical protein
VSLDIFGNSTTTPRNLGLGKLRTLSKSSHRGGDVYLWLRWLAPKPREVCSRATISHVAHDSRDLPRYCRLVPALLYTLTPAGRFSNAFVYMDDVVEHRFYVAWACPSIMRAVVLRSGNMRHISNCSEQRFLGHSSSFIRNLSSG